MPKHVKHQDSLDVQVRTKFLDKEGHEMPGVIEYDTATGYGKRIKDARLGLIEDFYQKDGSAEIDGNNFDDTNHDDDKIDAIKTLIDMNVHRNDANYTDLLDHHTKLHKDNKAKAKQLQQQQVSTTEATTPIINDNIYHPDEETRKARRDNSLNNQT